MISISLSVKEPSVWRHGLTIFQGSSRSDKRRFPSLRTQPLLSRHGHDGLLQQGSSPCPFSLAHTALRSPRCSQTEGFLFFWTQFSVKPRPPPTPKRISPCAHSISVSRKEDFICWGNKEKSRLKDKITISSYSQRRDFPAGDRRLILFALALHRNLFLPAQSAWLALQTEFECEMTLYISLFSHQ